MNPYSRANMEAAAGAAGLLVNPAGESHEYTISEGGNTLIVIDSVVLQILHGRADYGLAAFFRELGVAANAPANSSDQFRAVKSEFRLVFENEKYKRTSGTAQDRISERITTNALALWPGFDWNLFAREDTRPIGDILDPETNNGFPLKRYSRFLPEAGDFGLEMVRQLIARPTTHNTRSHTPPVNIFISYLEYALTALNELWRRKCDEFGQNVIRPELRDIGVTVIEGGAEGRRKYLQHYVRLQLSTQREIMQLIEDSWNRDFDTVSQVCAKAIDERGRMAYKDSEDEMEQRIQEFAGRKPGLCYSNATLTLGHFKKHPGPNTPRAAGPPEFSRLLVAHLKNCNVTVAKGNRKGSIQERTDPVSRVYGFLHKNLQTYRTATAMVNEDVKRGRALESEIVLMTWRSS